MKERVAAVMEIIRRERGILKGKYYRRTRQYP